MALTKLPEYLENAQHWINGEGASSKATETIAVVNPATGRTIASTPAGTIQDVDAAVATAYDAFHNGPWARYSNRQRAQVLIEVARLIRERGDELAKIESVDVGKPFGFAKSIDVNTVAETYEYAASLAQHLDGAARSVPIPAHAYTKREPLGVVAAITPFNFPLILSTTKIAYALAAGNTVVHKPAEDTPLSALYMARLLHDAGIPAGAYNLVTGYGTEIGEHLVVHRNVAKVAFTGSSSTGAHLASLAGQHLRPFTAELGGNAANIVFADANIEKAIETSISAFVFNTGQFCMAGPRLLVERPILEPVLEGLAGALPHVPLGDPMKPETVIGPLSTQRQLDKVKNSVQTAVNAGATVVTGGNPVESHEGYFYQPTVLTDLPNSHTAIQEEIFGPVLTVQAFDTEEEAIALANSTPYGLAGGVQTADISRAHRVSDALDAGIIWVNGWSLLDVSMPFGGVKASGWGRENGPEQMAEYTRAKSVIIAVEPAPAAPSQEGA